ncbi:NTP transferase domain-containing protein [Hyphomonas sp.]|jgi:molybdopterin-guanine dinucleotide biosynthesis protein A|uniref:molybdenum cofactor guanylyltransferase n=1 Tax=Hyphomonas sp. TaxID=87 RepID=UPI0032D965E8
MTVMGCLFAGGAGRRLGGMDKALIELSGSPLWRRATHRIAPMVDQMVVTGRTAPGWRKAVPGLVFVPDFQPNGGPIGPAGGLLAALEHGLLQNGPESFLLTVPIDAPFFPVELFEQLSAGRGSARAVLVETEFRLQPTFGLWSCALAPDVHACVEQGKFALHAIADHVGAAKVRFQAEEEAFLNINTPEDLQRAEVRAGLLGRS